MLNLLTKRIPAERVLLDRLIASAAEAGQESLLIGIEEGNPARARRYEDALLRTARLRELLEEIIRGRV